MTLQDLRDRHGDLLSAERRLTTCLERIRREREELEPQIAQAARDDLRLRPLASVNVPAPTVRKTPGHYELEDVRDAVVRLGEFTLGELATELGCDRRKAQRELDRVKHLVDAAGKLGRDPMFAYRPPDGPGEAFKAQQRLRPSERYDVVERDSDIKQSVISMISDKEIKEAVRDAIGQGWTLIHTGRGKHPMRLIRNGEVPITIASTPRSSGNAAKAIRRRLRQTA